jgi:hypothetical protein
VSPGASRQHAPLHRLDLYGLLAESCINERYGNASQRAEHGDGAGMPAQESRYVSHSACVRTPSEGVDPGQSGRRLCRRTRGGLLRARHGGANVRSASHRPRRPEASATSCCR